MSAEFEVRSNLDASSDRVWERIVTPAGINDELRPIVRMTIPRGVTRLDPAEVPLGRSLGRSWILLAVFRHRHRRLRRHFGGEPGRGWEASAARRRIR